VPPASISAARLAAIAGLSPNHFVVAGGTGAVSVADYNQLQAIVGASSIRRLGGKNRWQTAQLVNDWSLAQGVTVGEIAIATGDNFPDPLCCGVLLGKRAGLLVITPSTALPQISTWLALHKREITKVYWIGGDGALPQATRNAYQRAMTP
jgi:putative cell wall-binding protein